MLFIAGFKITKKEDTLANKVTKGEDRKEGELKHIKIKDRIHKKLKKIIKKKIFIEK